MAEIIRCPWCLSDPLMTRYHDREWGVPVHDDRLLFEFLVLEGAQAGLSWSTILKRRGGYREAFGGLDPEAVARFGPRQVEKLMKDEEEHIDFLETQLDLIQRVGLELYTQKHIGGLKSDGES